jgi:Holliday junction resolvase RusA-like endonuclease
VTRFFVPGIPQPGGSKRAFTVKKPDGGIGVRVEDDAKHGKPWRVAVAWAAKAAHQGPPLDGPLWLAVTFTMPRPKGHFGKRGLRKSAPLRPTVKPDTTKLLRALEDACTGILWRDDAQIVVQHVSKEYGEHPGARVQLATYGAEGPT